MKHTVFGISLAVIALLVIVTVLGVSEQNVRKNEMETSLNTAVEQSLEQLKIEKVYEIETYQELIADFNQSLLMQMESDADIQVDILAADIEKGVLDVKITAYYRNIFGQEKEAVCRKSVIMEEYSEPRSYYTVTFFVDGSIYDKYSVYEGGKPVLPVQPKKTGKVFRYWTKQGENRDCRLEEMQIIGNVMLEAVFE